MELVAQGNLEVMVTEDCLPCLASGEAAFWGLQDFKRVFPLRTDNESRTHIFNSVETCLIDHMPKIFEIGLDSISIDARGRTGKYAKEMAGLYRTAIELTAAGGGSLKEDLEALKKEARLRSLGGITSGHFIKGLREEVAIKTEHK
jgi:putative protease